jgi:hypothetical protein
MKVRLPAAQRIAEYGGCGCSGATCMLHARSANPAAARPRCETFPAAPPGWSGSPETNARRHSGRRRTAAATARTQSARPFPLRRDTLPPKRDGPRAYERPASRPLQALTIAPTLPTSRRPRRCRTAPTARRPAPRPHRQGFSSQASPRRAVPARPARSRLRDTSGPPPETAWSESNRHSPPPASWRLAQSPTLGKIPRCW